VVQRVANRQVGITDPTGLRTIVAVLLTHHGRLCLLRRSALVGSDRGRWHCVTGFLEPGVDPERQVLAELAEETGLRPEDLTSFVAGPALHLPDGRAGSWRVLLYRAESQHDRVSLNWEHDDACWVPWPEADQDGRVLVPWLADLVMASGLPVAA
jgi:ADP-ribose pyrophosphatase YjhB (NUDIX family)